MKHLRYLEYGMRFRKLRILKVVEDSKLHKDGKKVIPSLWKYKCECDCGNNTIVCRANLFSGVTSSCGCYAIERSKKVNCKVNATKYRKGYIKIFLANSDKYTVIDKEDYFKIKDYYWRVSFNGKYVYTVIMKKGKSKHMLLHRLLTDFKYAIVDHKDGDRLNNRKTNLREATLLENRSNSKKFRNNKSGYKGVSWSSRDNKWRGSLTYQGKQYHLGLSNDPEELSKKYNELEKELHGEFAYSNRDKL